MVHIRKTASAGWRGTASAGEGVLDLGEVSLPFSLRSRVSEGPSSNPEELLGAALAGCFAMSLANLCEERSTPAERIDARATVHLVGTEEGFRIPTIELSCLARVPGVAEEVVRELAEQAERTCPVRLLYTAEVKLSVVVE